MMNSDLQHKLQRFETDPPLEVWNKIADALDETGTFPQRLFSYEELPPSQAWNKIEASLDQKEKFFKVIPFTRFKKPLRYAAVAASILAIVLLVATLDTKKTGAGAVIGGTEPVVTTNQSSILPLEKSSTVPDNKSNPPATSFSGDVVNKTTRAAFKKTLAAIRPQNIISSFSITQRFIPGKIKKEALVDNSSISNYMVYSDGEGTAMKLPKKLFSFVNCKDGDESCKERIHQLQQKLANKATTTDFGGMLEILRQLQ
jgi:hypothetical protein